MARASVIALTVLGLLLFCRPLPAAETPKDDSKVAEAVNAFATDLYARLSSEEGNLFFSPASISTALAMTYAGARGTTASEMAKVLHFDLAGDSLHQEYGALLAKLNTPAPSYELRVANALWGQKIRTAKGPDVANGSSYYKQDFLDLVQKHYGGGFRELDFAQSEAARGVINEWVEEQTNRKIANLIPSGVLSAYTRLVLTNAIYFKGTWTRQFSKDATIDRPFHLAEGGGVAVPMMSQTEDFLYAEEPGLQVLEMPYKGGDLSMVVFLPEAGKSLSEFERRLDAARLKALVDGLVRAEVTVLLPRFKTTRQLELSEILKAMGMPTAFSPDAADFSAITEAERLYISRVIHKAFVDVNEEGTEAAAATAVAMAPASAAMEPPKVFKADRPFLFIIRDTESGAILFMGRVSDPRK